VVSVRNRQKQPTEEGTLEMTRKILAAVVAAATLAVSGTTLFAQNQMVPADSPEAQCIARVSGFTGSAGLNALAKPTTTGTVVVLVYAPGNQSWNCIVASSGTIANISRNDVSDS
jgi:hypothetical protein